MRSRNLNRGLSGLRSDRETWTRLLPYQPPEYIRWHLRRIRTCLNHLLTHISLEGKAVLDIGHDPFVGPLIRDGGAKLFGNLGPEQSPPAPSFVAWPLVQFDLHRTLPFRDSTFDVVTMLEVFEHVQDDPRRMLTEIHRVLKPNGYLYIGTPNAVAWDKIMRSLRQATLYDSLPFSNEYGPKHGMSHAYEYGAYELRELLKSQDFEIVNLSTWNPYHNDVKGPRQGLLRLLFTVSLLTTGYLKEAALLWYRRGHQLSIIARKSGSILA